MLVVAAGTPWDGVWSSERHVAVRLAERIPVLWVDPPMSWLTPLRRGGAGGSAWAAALREPRLRLATAPTAPTAPAAASAPPAVARLTPVVTPGVTRPGLRQAARLAHRLAIRRAVARVGAPVAAVLVASLDDVLDVVADAHPAARRVFYGTDDFVAGAALMGVSADGQRRGERRQLAKADLTIAISPSLQERWSARGAQVVLVPNGCDAERFADTERAPRPPDVRLRGPVAGFVGHLSDRIGPALLEAVVDGGTSLLLVGPRMPGFPLDRLLAAPNVAWVGAKPFESLPSYLRAIDVGVTPYRDTAFNRASFPLKTLEYLAAGRAAVSTDLPGTRWLDTELVTIASAPAEFAAAVRTAAAAAAQASPEVAAGRAAERRAFAARHSWSRRAEEIAGLLELPVPAWADVPSETERLDA
jgi:teichuronic acid biosynthesis glycosyltransferase TuaH